MMKKTLPLAALLSLAACDTQPAEFDTELMTTYGHVVDDRAWAVGSTMYLEATVTGPRRNIVVDFESADGEVIAGTSDSYAGEGYIPGPWDLMYGPGLSSSYAYADAAVNEAGGFEIVVNTARGKEISRTPLMAEEPAGYALGVVLDDCPEFPDLVFREDPTMLEGSEVMLAPAPIGEGGDQLVGHFDFGTSGDGVEVDAWGGDYAYVTVGGDDFTLSFEIDGASHDFDIKTAGVEEIVEIEIADVPEKHGMANQSLLCVIGRTADGAPVHGIAPEWSTGWTAPTVHADNFSTVDACFGELCASWEGPDAGADPVQ